MPAASTPYFTLQRQIPAFRKELDAALRQVIESGQFILGPTVESFEKKFAEYCGVKYAVGVASGTDALILAFRCLGIGKGDEVIVPSYTYSATVFGIIHNGATPIFADIDPDTFSVDPESIDKKITRRTKAILPVHLYGQAANMTRITQIAKKNRLKIVEDVAQAHGAAWNGKKTGSFGDFGCFSFYPTKNLGALGDGGMLTTNSGTLYKKALTFRNLGHINFRDDHKEIGWTSRLDAIQAAVLNLKLPFLDGYNAHRQSRAARYKANLKNIPLIFNQEPQSGSHVYHLLIARVPNGKRDALQAFLSQHGITSLTHYKKPFHRQPAYLKLYPKKKWVLPHSEQASREVLALPMFPEMTDSEVDEISNLIKQFYKENG